MSNIFRSSNRSQLSSGVYTTQNQGGGSKKAGFPYQIGRSTWTSVAFHSTDPVHGHCYLLGCYNTNRGKNASISRPIGSVYSPNTYFHIPGTR